MRPSAKIHGDASSPFTHNDFSSKAFLGERYCTSKGELFPCRVCVHGCGVHSESERSVILSMTVHGALGFRHCGNFCLSAWVSALRLELGDTRAAVGEGGHLGRKTDGDTQRGSQFNVHCGCLVFMWISVTQIKNRSYFMTFFGTGWGNHTCLGLTARLRWLTSDSSPFPYGIGHFVLNTELQRTFLLLSKCPLFNKVVMLFALVFWYLGLKYAHWIEVIGRRARM